MDDGEQSIEDFIRERLEEGLAEKMAEVIPMFGSCLLCGAALERADAVRGERICEPECPPREGEGPKLLGILDGPFIDVHTTAGSTPITRRMLAEALERDAERRQARAEFAASLIRRTPIEAATEADSVLVWINAAECLGLVVPREVAEDAKALGYELAHEGHQRFFVQNRVAILSDETRVLR